MILKVLSNPNHSRILGSVGSTRALLKANNYSHLWKTAQIIFKKGENKDAEGITDREFTRDKEFIQDTENSEFGEFSVCCADKFP